jgi:uncharacterized protein YutE (UPF0331/DUF86 family)
MVDREAFLNHLNELQNSIENLKKLQKEISLDEFKKDRTKRNSVLHELQIAIQSCIDLGNHFISEKSLAKPETYKEIFDILKHNALIEDDIAEKMKELAGFRNVLVHMYLNIDLNKAYHILNKEIPSLERFKKIAGRWLEE